MKILSHINESKFIIKQNNKYFLVSLIKNEAIEIEDPNEIYRQGYWEKFNDNLSDKKNKKINELIKNSLQIPKIMV